jgi:peptidoglycan/xylan/chitin deacetylase (PgdA/CDA1 family)
MHPPVWYIRWLIEKNLVPGTIVILHDGIANPKRSIAALPQILAAGREKGLRFVSVGELMGRRVGENRKLETRRQKLEKG